MIRDTVRQIELAKPAVGQVQMHFFAEPPFRSNAEAVSDEQHPDQTLWNNRRAARVTVEIRQIRADTAEVNEPVNRPHQMILRDVILQ